MQTHVFDFRWLSPEECVIQASLNDQFGQRKIHLNDSISIEILSDISCAGSFVDEKWISCAEKLNGKAKCKLCRARERSHIYTSFDGFNRDAFSDQELNQIRGEHLVYLAFFDKDLIKVGVSHYNRKELRQLEQGSHFTFFIAKTPDGILARQIETLLRKCGIKDKVNPSQKSKFLCPEITKEEGWQTLENVYKNSISALDNYPHLQEFLFTHPEFVSWEIYSGLDNIDIIKKPLQFISLTAGESVSGKIIAIKGIFLVLEMKDELLFLSMKKLFGRIVDFSEKPEGLKLKEPFQSTLF